MKHILRCARQWGGSSWGTWTGISKNMLLYWGVLGSWGSVDSGSWSNRWSHSHYNFREKI